MTTNSDTTKIKNPVQNKRKPRKLKVIKKNTETIGDLEVAKKMIKIYQSAQDRKLEFNLSFESVKKLLLHQTCYYTNRAFEEEGAFSRSFDRIDSAKGYIENNVVACTVDINGKKSNLSMDEIECLYTKMIRFHNKQSDVILEEVTEIPDRDMYIDIPITDNQIENPEDDTASVNVDDI